MSNLTIRHSKEDRKFWGKSGKVSLLYRVLREDLIGEVAFGNRPKGMQVSEGRAFQTQGTAKTQP